ncbi:Cysteine--tRNA ligase [Dictyocoela muelleri]|nr:Cysteine--tRNA ligase [Dictyocoela muelleri]
MIDNKNISYLNQMRLISQKNINNPKMTLKIFNTLTQENEEFVSKKTIKWYICGPTVYDSSHIGHARTYVTCDMIRGILEDYLGYDILYVMNITDIDDKIMARANETYGNVKDGFKMIIEKYENEFFNDMDRLNVKRPSIVTRVTEYIEKIKEFVEKLIEKGYAYESNGSVYFDSYKFKQKYKIKLFNREIGASDENNKNYLNENNDENSVSRQNLENNKLSPNFVSEKRNPEDFALWKKVKDGEIFFESQWGPGRPGWHIECSAMASDIFGNNIDIHSGGIDLRFPHHENEILQSMAYFDSKWVNYFLHTGHLHIDGHKMSKSLKNFITIQDCLKKYTPRQLRLFFALNAYGSPIDYHEETMKNVIVVEKRIFNFLSRIKAQRHKFKTLSNHEKKALKFFNDCKENVHTAFLNNFDIPLALQSILNFISQINESVEFLSSDVLNIFYDFIKKILKILRIESEAASVMIKNNLPQILCNYRNEIRKAAKEQKNFNYFFKLSDDVRDAVKEEGFIIEDKGKESFIRKVE